MGQQSSSDDLGALPTQQVVEVGHAQRITSQMNHPKAAAAVRAPPPEHVTPTQVKCPAFWEKSSFRLERGSAKHLWTMTAEFTAEEPVDLFVHFNCRERLNGEQMECIPIEEGGPPVFKQRYGPGKQTFRMDGSQAIDLKRWPLEVFWKFKRQRADVVPIILSLESRGVQLVTHFSLEVQTSRSMFEAVQLHCVMLKQKAVVNGREYPMQEVYGLADLGGKDHDNEAAGEPCVICLTDPRNTVVLPCQHLCCCEECAGHLRMGAAVRGEKCPICRGPVSGIRVFGVK